MRPIQYTQYTSYFNKQIYYNAYSVIYILLSCVYVTHDSCKKFIRWWWHKKKDYDYQRIQYAYMYVYILYITQSNE